MLLALKAFLASVSIVTIFSVPAVAVGAGGLIVLISGHHGGGGFVCRG
jgi:hypothetical protein